VRFTAAAWTSAAQDYSKVWYSSKVGMGMGSVWVRQAVEVERPDLEVPMNGVDGVAYECRLALFGQGTFRRGMAS
jgi:hypothetical protein